MSIARAVEMMAAAHAARETTAVATEALQRLAQQKEWRAVEVLRVEAVAAFEAMLDATIAAQREVSL